MTVVTPTDRPKSVRNLCDIEVFGGVCVLSFFRIFGWYRGFCHRTETDLLPFLFVTLFFFLISCWYRGFCHRTESHLFFFSSISLVLTCSD